MDGSLNRVTIPKLGSLELPLQLCRNPEIPCLGNTLFFFYGVLPERGPPGAPSTLVRLAHTLFVHLEVGLGWSGTDSGFTSAKQLHVVVRALLECDRAMWLYPWPWEPWDSATSRPPLLCRRCHTTFPYVTMADMRASPPLAPLSVAAGWRNRDIPTKKWQCPCGKVLPIVQNPDSKAYSVHCSGTQHTDWVRYGKVVPEFFQGSISADTPLLGMLIRVDKHPQLLGAVRVASTLAAASAAAVVRLGPISQVPNLDVDYAMDTDPDLDTVIPLRERKCPGVLPRQAGTPQQLRRMYPVMRGNYEKPHWEFCDRRGLFALDCRMMVVGTT